MSIDYDRVACSTYNTQLAGENYRPSLCGVEAPDHPLNKGSTIKEDIEMTLPALANSANTPKVSIHNGKAVTTSLDVADYFRKLHKDVLKKIDSLDCSPEFTSANFCADVQSIEIGNGARRDSKIYEMTKDGFVFLVMGFTGKKAAAFKEAYISEFNRMEAELNTRQLPTPDIKRYQIRVIIHDEVTGLTGELRGESDSLRQVAFGICTDLGFKPNSFTHVPPKPQIKKLH